MIFNYNIEKNKHDAINIYLLYLFIFIVFFVVLFNCINESF